MVEIITPCMTHALTPSPIAKLGVSWSPLGSRELGVSWSPLGSQELGASWGPLGSQELGASWGPLGSRRLIEQKAPNKPSSLSKEVSLVVFDPPTLTVKMKNVVSSQKRLSRFSFGTQTRKMNKEAEVLVR